MSGFTLTGNFDEISRQLKEAFDAREAKFNADFVAQFNAPPPRAAAVAPASKDSKAPTEPKPSTAPAAELHATAGWSLGGNRLSTRKDSESFSGRLRNPRSPSR